MVTSIQINKIFINLINLNVVLCIFFVIAYPSPLYTSLLRLFLLYQYHPTVLSSERLFRIVEMHTHCTRERQVQRTCILTGQTALGDFRSTKAHGIEWYGNFFSGKKFSTLPEIRILDLQIRRQGSLH